MVESSFGRCVGHRGATLYKMVKSVVPTQVALTLTGKVEKKWVMVKSQMRRLQEDRKCRSSLWKGAGWVEYKS